jgi:hypothetical protein
MIFVSVAERKPIKRTNCPKKLPNYRVPVGWKSAAIIAV